MDKDAIRVAYALKNGISKTGFTNLEEYRDDWEHLTVYEDKNNMVICWNNLSPLNGDWSRGAYYYSEEDILKIFDNVEHIPGKSYCYVYYKYVWRKLKYKSLMERN